MAQADYLWRGRSVEEIVRHYPYLTLAGVHAALGCYFDPPRRLAQFWLSELSIRNGMALSKRKAWVFDLAGDFPYTIVIPVDFMTFQGRGHSEEFRGSWLVPHFVALPFAFGGLYGIDKVFFRGPEDCM